MAETKFAQKNQPCYDKDGNFLGWYSRSVAVAGFIYCMDKEGKWYVLGSERGKDTPDFQGYWNCVCGYCEFDLDLKENLMKEAQEELGIEISKDDILFADYEDSPSANHQNITFRFAVIYRDGKTIEDFNFSREGNEGAEVGEIKWIPLDEVENYKWAFGHDVIIKQYAERYGLVEIDYPLEM